jgi:hypothetical protein
MRNIRYINRLTPNKFDIKLPPDIESSMRNHFLVVLSNVCQPDICFSLHMPSRQEMATFIPGPVVNLWTWHEGMPVNNHLL